jgi:hypothetical protein
MTPELMAHFKEILSQSFALLKLWQASPVDREAIKNAQLELTKVLRQDYGSDHFSRNNLMSLKYGTDLLLGKNLEHSATFRVVKDHIDEAAKVIRQFEWDEFENKNGSAMIRAAMKIPTSAEFKAMKLMKTETLSNRMSPDGHAVVAETRLGGNHKAWQVDWAHGLCRETAGTQFEGPWLKFA